MNNMIHTNQGNVYAPGLKARGHHQHARVQQGISNGSLSQDELSSLKDMRSDARADLAAAKGNNGSVGPRERRALHQDLNQISQAIFQFKHN